MLHTSSKIFSNLIFSFIACYFGHTNVYYDEFLNLFLLDFLVLENRENHLQKSQKSVILCSTARSLTISNFNFHRANHALLNILKNTLVYLSFQMGQVSFLSPLKKNPNGNFTMIIHQSIVV